MSIVQDSNSLSNLVDILAEGIDKFKCKDCNCFLECESVNDNFKKYECLTCNKNYSSKIDEKFKKRFRSTHKFSNNDSNKFIILLRKAAYTYEYMDNLKKFSETSLPKKTFL